MAGMSRHRHESVVDAVDAVDAVETAPVEETKSVGKRIQAIPFSGGTTVVIRKSDFEKAGVEHASVTWDYRIDDFTVEVGKGITEEAANTLVNNFPDSFKFL
jgi:hypothetical protein